MEFGKLRIGISPQVQEGVVTRGQNLDTYANINRKRTSDNSIGLYLQKHRNIVSIAMSYTSKKRTVTA